MMENIDKEIFEKQLASTIGKAVSQWTKKNGITAPVSVNASVTEPDCYVDEVGVVHYGPVVACNVHILDPEEFYDDDEDDQD